MPEHRSGFVSLVGQGVGFGLLLSCLLGSSEVVAGSWEIKPQIKLQGTYSDNIGRDIDGLESEEFVTELKPGISVRGRGRRVTLDFDYQLQQLKFNNAGSSTTNHQFQALSTLELVRNHLNLDASSTLTQRNQSNTTVATDNLSNTNRNDVLTWKVGPRWTSRLGRLAVLDAGLSADEVTINGVSGADSEAFKYDARISSRPGARTLSWSLFTKYNRIRNESGTSNSFRKLEGNLQYRVGLRYSLLAALGREANSFASSQTRQDGGYWNIGASWVPSQRTSFSATVGRRFFGRTLGVDMRHRTRRTVWDLSVDEETGTTRSTFLESRIFQLVDPFGQVIIDPLSNQPATATATVPTVADDVFVRRSISASMTMQGRRSTVSLSAFSNRREFQLVADTEKSFGGQAELVWQFSRTTSSTAALDWSRESFRASVVGAAGREDDRLRFRINLQRKLGQRSTALVEYQREDRDSNQLVSNYTENRLVAWLNYQY